MLKNAVNWLTACTVDKEDVVLAAANSENTWVQANKCIITLADKKTLLTFGSLLTGKHVNYAQTLLRHLFTNNVTGLQSTLLQYKPLIKKWAEGLQIIHYHECHWVVAHKVTASRVLGIQRWLCVLTHDSCIFWLNARVLILLFLAVTHYHSSDIII